ncbi:hypothetical protein DIPPA_00883 [Diplonema papillatum]|nr:hypothetical protein DIPPA_35013 [Diplonema papillatum]KAJ9442625.1 hypothetical protein DIPPA_00883 [Diplonema papillatum]
MHMRLMDDSSDPDALVQLGWDTIHRMMVLKTVLKACWSLAGGLQHRHKHQAGFPPYLRNVFQALQKPEEQPPKPSRKRSPKSRTQHSGEAHPDSQLPQRATSTKGRARQWVPWTVSHLLWRGDAGVLSCRSPRSPPASGNVLSGPQTRT